MPRQNRVTPFGEIVAVPDRGMLMGNRGLLHDATGTVRKAWQLRRWIVCELQFKGRKRQVMAPGRYTELFFLDEATALAAGHRPCAECRRGRFDAFRRALGSPLTAPQLDARLHAERLAADGSQRTHPAGPGDLPDGVFVRLAEPGGGSYLVWGGGLLRWTPGGYADRVPKPRRAAVTVLTPESTVAAIRNGYAPAVHPSAKGH